MRRWQLSEHVIYPRDIFSMLRPLSKTMTTDGACFIPKGYITMLWPLSCDDDNCRSRFHAKGIYYHDLSVVMRRLQLSEYVLYLRDILPCSDPSHATMTNVGAYFIPKVYITMLWPLSWDDDNCRSMFLRWMKYYHALSVVMRRWQWSKHVSYLRDNWPCSDRCHKTITTVGACFIPKGHITMLWLLFCDDDSCRSMFHI